MNENLTVEDAKASAQAWELRLANLVPAENVASIEQAEFGKLTKCSEEGAYAWTGYTHVFLSETVDVEAADAITEAVAEELGDNPDSTHDVALRPGEHLYIEVSGPNGEFHQARTLPTFGEDGSVFLIASASECFRLPDDLNPGANY